VQAGLLTALTVLVLFARRPDQFLHPYIWVEDGRYILAEYAERGAWTLTVPLAGYLLTVTKVISVVAYKVSILWAPEIELVLVVAFTCAVVVAVGLSPTHLRWPFLCACAVLLMPSESEVFAVSSYAFWWAGILLLLALLWDPDRGREWLRWLFLVVGGLSSPIILPVVALLALRAGMERRKSEYRALGLAGAMTVLQLLAMCSQQVDVAGRAGEVLPVAAPFIVQTLIGNFFCADRGGYVGWAALALLVLAGWSARSRLDRHFLLLVLTFVLLAVTVVVRTGVFGFAAFHSQVLAPRYYFYPFVVLSQILIWVAAVSAWPVRALVAAAFATAVLLAQALRVNDIGLSRRHDAFDWKAEILACSRSEQYDVPVHYIGHADEMWHVTLTGEECRGLLRQSLWR
jgi:hypothetical protein